MSLSGQHVLVIGGLGFIGMNLTRQLVEAGASVTVLTPARARHAEQAEAFERHGVHVAEGDIRDRERVTTLVAGQQVVFNLSGQNGAVRSMEDPWTDLDINLRGNLVLLEAIRAAAPGAKVVFAGSRLQYGRVDHVPVAEDAAATPLCLHAVHKRTVEEYLKLYGELFGLRYTIARITNPYGPGQPKGRTAYGVINRMIELAIADQPLTVYGDGAQRRDYVHVDDVAAALLLMAESPAADGRAYNVGSGVGTRLVDLAAQVVAAVGRGRVTHVPWPALAQQIETGDFVADISRAARELAWTPAVPLAAGLRQTIAHYQTAS